MSNPLYSLLGGGNSLIQQFNQFKNSFTGDPRQQIQQLLNSGRMTQQQYNDLVQKANQIAPMLGIKK